jgi:hypothetical protein
MLDLFTAVIETWADYPGFRPLLDNGEPLQVASSSSAVGNVHQCVWPIVMWLSRQIAEPFISNALANALLELRDGGPADSRPGAPRG